MGSEFDIYFIVELFKTISLVGFTTFFNPFKPS